MQSGSHRLSLRCRITRPFLGHRRQQNGTRIFDTYKEGDATYFYPDVPQWRWALKEAMDSLGLLAEVDVDYVRLPTKILAPTIRLYTRVWDSKNQDKREMFQSFQAGAVLTIPLFILNELEPSGFSNTMPIEQRAPTAEEVTECFRVIGKEVGLSPWGSKFGYGRFTVEDNQ